MTCFLPKALYGIIGWPLGHSLSPLMHNTGFQKLGMEAVYMSWPLQPDKLEEFLKGMRILRIGGCSVTIPHKIAVMEYLDSISEAAAMTGAVNTLYWRDDTLCGDNTDVAGFLAPLQKLKPEYVTALVLGAGGAAHAVVAGLRLWGCSQVRITSRTYEKQAELAARFGFTSVLWEKRHQYPANLIINATPLGMSGKFEAETPYDFGLAPHVDNAVAYDLVYNPVQTRFLREAAKAGRKTISGLEMFVGQGRRQFEIWTGRELPQEAESAVRSYLLQGKQA